MKMIDSIEIKNFKSIRHQKIEGCKRVNVFIGYPNTGKSNILEALSLFSIDENNFKFGNFIRIEKLTTLFCDGNVSVPAEVRINDKHRYIARFENDRITFKEQFEKEGTSFEKADSGRIFYDHSNDVELGKNFKLLENKIDVIEYKSSFFGKDDRLASIRKYEFLKHIIYLSKGFSYLSYPYGDNIFSIISGNIDLKNDVQELFIPYNLELLYDFREQKFTILKRTSSGVFSIPYELVADTLQRVVFYKAAISSNRETVLLFEEPEAHMFPPYVSKFTADVIYDKNDNQFFIATHSPFVLNDFMEDMDKDHLSIYAVGYTNGETTVNRLTDKQVTDIYQYGVDLFFNLEDFLKDVVS
jgi:AAA15 family ATPase/GTPase